MKLRKLLLASAVLGGLVAGGAYMLSAKPKADEQVSSVAHVEENHGSDIAASATANPKSASKNWAKRCEKDSAYCEVFQRLDIKETKKRLVEVAIGYPKGQDKARLAAVLPLGLSLPDGMVLQVAGQKDVRSDIKTCTEAGCVAFVGLGNEFLSAMKKSDRMTLVLKDSSGKKVNIIMSLGGLSDALKHID